MAAEGYPESTYSDCEFELSVSASSVLGVDDDTRTDTRASDAEEQQQQQQQQEEGTQEQSVRQAAE